LVGIGFWRDILTSNSIPYTGVNPNSSDSSSGSDGGLSAAISAAATATIAAII
jgi:hypothetical protein